MERGLLPFPPGGKTGAFSTNRAVWGQEDYRHLGTKSLAAECTIWLLFRNGTGVAQQEHLSQSSTQGLPSPEVGMGWLQTSTA